MTQGFLSPDADLAAGGWTNEAGGATLFESLDEAGSPVDADYIRSASYPVDDTCLVRLSNPSGSVDTGQPIVIHYRYRKTPSVVALSFTVDLIELSSPDNVIATWTHSDVSDGFATAEQTLTEGEAASIADFDALALRFTATSVSDFTSLAVNADGWTLDATITSVVDGGTYAGLNDYDTPGLELTVQSRSWTTGGVETTTSRTVIATTALRKGYPDHATRDETEVSGDLQITLTLSDFIYADDTITSCTIATGLYTDDGAGGSNEVRGDLTPSVTNNSTLDYPLPIGMWINHDRDWVKANSYTVRLAVAHAYFRSGQMVRAVKFIATDVSTNTTSVIVTSMSKVDFTGSGLSAPCFEGSLDFTGLTQGEVVTIDAIIYPWVGDEYQISVDGSAYPSPNLTVLKVLNDRTGAYGTVYAYVDAVGGGTPAVHETAATAATTPYSTIALAAADLQTYINANFGRNNVSGGIIRLTATSHAHSTYSARAVGEIPLLIEAADVADRATTIYTDNGVSVSNGCCDYLKIKDITLQKVGGDVIFLDMSTVSTGVMVIENCIFDLNGTTTYGAWIFRCAHLYFINCQGAAGQASQFSTNLKQAISIGSGEGSINNANSAVYRAIGCKDLNATFRKGSLSTATPVGSFLGWNFLGRASSSTIISPDTPDTGPGGFAIVGNVMEIRTANTIPALQLNGTDLSGSHTNILDIANTFVGARSNALYSTVAGGLRHAFIKHSVHHEYNSKGDVFATDGTLQRNWAHRHGVGSSHRVTLVGGQDASTYGPGSWMGEFAWRGNADGSSATPLNADWTNDQSFEGGDAGNGDYTPGASTALPQIPAGETAFPFDLLGRAVPTDGTAYVGAVQQA